MELKSVNLKKTQIIIFKESGYKGKMPAFKFGNSALKLVKEYKYLGTTVTNTGNFKLNEVYLKKKGLRATYLLTQSIRYSKPSTAIKLFEKIVEPILTYNCEVALATLPKSWDYGKFVFNIWNHGNEVNRVTTSFLRQILGVHKKTSNIALMSETGKLPTIMKVYNQIYKYWIRINDTEKELLKEALKINISDYNKGKNTWYKIVDYLRRLTLIDSDEPNTAINMFKKSMKILFQMWWTSESQREETKLDFYFSLKKNFGFETYLDNIDHSARTAITKLRMSCHCFPIEILRYYGIEREDRTCNICASNKIGDENHYLIHCQNKRMVDIRLKFATEVKKILPQMENFSIKDLMAYCISMKDTSIQGITAKFAGEIYKGFKMEDNTPPLRILCLRKIGKIRKPPRCRTNFIKHKRGSS